MKIRHLEMMGYKIVLLNQIKWASLASWSSKLDYLNELIGIEKFEDKINR